ncbi:MAG: GNAT family N-acetyltransferase, partial [Patescibacteria group bacterium]
GFGYALWQEARKIFNPKKDIILHVASYNQKAIDFYKKLGFKSTDEIFFDEKSKMRNGAMIPELKMIIKKQK